MAAIDTFFRTQAYSKFCVKTRAILGLLFLNLFLFIPSAFSDEIILTVGAAKTNITLKTSTGKSVRVAGSRTLNDITLQWNLKKDNFTGDGTAGYTGTVTFTNNASTTRRVSFAVQSSVRHRLVQTSKSGSTFLALSLNKDGGSLTSFGTESIVTYLVDGSRESTLFSAPFAMGASGGPSTTSTSANFGFPVGSAAGSGIDRSIGLKVAGKLTAGEKLKASVAFQISGTAD